MILGYSCWAFRLYVYSLVMNDQLQFQNIPWVVLQIYVSLTDTITLKLGLISDILKLNFTRLKHKIDIN